MIGSLLDTLFSGQNIKRLASVCFCLPIIAAIVIGIKAGEGFLFILLCILIGFVAGVILSFTWHVLGQILDFLEKICNYSGRIYDYSERIYNNLKGIK